MNTAVDFSAVVLCDDIRKEITNKDILIGVYAGDILVKSFPQWLRMAVWMEIAPREIGEHPLSLRLRLEENPPLLIDMQLQVHSLGPSSVAVSGLELLAEKEGNLLLELKDGPNWRLLKQKNIRQGGALPPLAAPTLSSGEPRNG
jgi:hypothetical protein